MKGTIISHELIHISEMPWNPMTHTHTHTYVCVISCAQQQNLWFRFSQKKNKAKIKWGENFKIASIAIKTDFEWHFTKMVCAYKLGFVVFSGYFAFYRETDAEYKNARNQSKIVARVEKTAYSIVYNVYMRNRCMHHSDRHNILIGLVFDLLKTLPWQTHKHTGRARTDPRRSSEFSVNFPFSMYGSHIFFPLSFS